MSVMLLYVLCAWVCVYIVACICDCWTSETVLTGSIFDMHNMSCRSRRNSFIIRSRTSMLTAVILLYNARRISKMFNFESISATECRIHLISKCFCHCLSTNDCSTVNPRYYHGQHITNFGLWGSYNSCVFDDIISWSLDVSLLAAQPYFLQQIAFADRRRCALLCAAIATTTTTTTMKGQRHLINHCN